MTPAPFLSFDILLPAFAIVFCGAYAQGIIGFGLAMLISPPLRMLSPDFLPGPVLLLVVVMTTTMVWNERSNIDGQGVKRTFGGILLGTVVAVLVLGILPQRETSILLAILILAAVVLSLSGLNIRPGRTVLFGAGLLGGFMGTICGVSLPPLAIALQNEPVPQRRASLACIGLFSVCLSLAALAMVGRITLQECLVAALLTPAVVLGYATARRSAHFFNATILRYGLFLFTSISALTLLFSQ